MGESYIFGYQSILAAGSLATSVGSSAFQADWVAARLADHQRCWTAVRHFPSHGYKRYVRHGNWDVVDTAAFANLRSRPGLFVNGICRKVSNRRLPELDFREEGYTRVQIAGGLQTYPGYVLDPQVPCYVYIDQQAAGASAPVSRAYWDMGRMGAEQLDAGIQGFLGDYLRGTELPTELAAHLSFVFFSADAMHLWLLCEADSSLVLLQRFERPQFAGLPVTGQQGIAELQRPITPHLAWLDLRSRHRAPSLHPAIAQAMADLLTEQAPVPDRLCDSPFWLCRLSATQAAGVSAHQLQQLAADADHWVSRAARIELESRS
jgi:hypothetical protein